MKLQKRKTEKKLDIFGNSKQNLSYSFLNWHYGPFGITFDTQILGKKTIKKSW